MLRPLAPLSRATKHTWTDSDSIASAPSTAALPRTLSQGITDAVAATDSRLPIISVSEGP
jgi:hypothetical protein